MADQIQILTSGPLNARIRPPGSKSITNRALICAALASGTSTLAAPLKSDDTKYMVECLTRLGIRITDNPHADELRVEGRAGRIPNGQAELFVGNSGTTIRFVTALAALGRGHYVLDGVPRMRERPIQDLIDALNAWGAEVASQRGNGCPPVVLHARGLRGGDVSVRGDVSSQFLSGLLLAAPCALTDARITVEGDLVSRPYVALTTAIMEAFGVHVMEHKNVFEIRSGQTYHGRHYEIEPDASAASYFWAAAAVCGGQATVLGLTPDSLQGDVRFCDLLVRMGCKLHAGSEAITVTGASRLRGIDCDMNEVSDTVQTLAAVALFAEGPTTIRGVAHNRFKETDRIGNLAVELRKFGANVDELTDGLRIHPPGQLRAATVETYDDHRMAMSLALPGLRVPGVVVKDPGCTAKTYPGYFEDLMSLRRA